MVNRSRSNPFGILATKVVNGVYRFYGLRLSCVEAEHMERSVMMDSHKVGKHKEAIQS
uniref:Uncharacterized protein n=1 Tax=Rhizophora mucronata TaxID=61149 RepID=A0A2P2QYV9_RHIMU